MSQRSVDQPANEGADGLRGLDLEQAVRCVELSALAYESAQEGAVRSPQYGYDEFRAIAGPGGRHQLIVLRRQGLRYVAIRGTQGLRNWITNLAAWTVSTPYGPVHRGYYEACTAVLPQVRAALLEEPACPAILTGHSMGGALALLTALLLEQEGVPISALYTFGQPRTGGKAFTAQVERQLAVPYFRFVHGADALATWSYGSKALLGTPCYFDLRGRLGFGQRLNEIPRPNLKFHRLEHYRYFLRLNRLRLQVLEEDNEVTRIQD